MLPEKGTVSGALSSEWGAAKMAAFMLSAVWSRRGNMHCHSGLQEVVAVRCSRPQQFSRPAALSSAWMMLFLCRCPSRKLLPFTAFL